MKKALRETQTLHAGCSRRNQKFRPAAVPHRRTVRDGCSKAEPKFPPRRRPPSRGRRTAKI